MDIICINGNFSVDQLNFYKQFGVEVPKQDSLYTIRDVIINSSGENGLLLDQIINPKVPIKHPLLGIAEMEPNWNIERFRMLDESKIDIIKVKQSLKVTV